jgi:hypothetical protein
MEDLIPWLAFGLPLLIVAALLAWFLGKPALEARRLEERAAAGDPEAQAALARAEDLKGVLRGAIGVPDAERQRLLLTGRLTRATILDVRPLGLAVSHGPIPSRIVEVTLALEGGDGRAITVRDSVSELHLGRLLKGATVPVRVDPDNSQRLVVLWDTL